MSHCCSNHLLCILAVHSPFPDLFLPGPETLPSAGPEHRIAPTNWATERALSFSLVPRPRFYFPPQEQWESLENASCLQTRVSLISQAGHLVFNKAGLRSETTWRGSLIRYLTPSLCTSPSLCVVQGLRAMLLPYSVSALCYHWSAFHPTNKTAGGVFGNHCGLFPI